MMDPLIYPMPFASVIVAALAFVLHVSIRNGGWFPIFRQLSIRRALIVSLLLWGLSVLLATLRATPYIPVAHGRGQPVSARVIHAQKLWQPGIPAACVAPAQSTAHSLAD